MLLISVIKVVPENHTKVKNLYGTRVCDEIVVNKMSVFSIWFQLADISIGL